MQNAANLYISAYPPVRWTDIADKLSPNNNLSIDQARTMAAQTTQVQIAQFMSTFAAGLGIGLPVNTKSVTTQLAADGTTSTTGTKTKGPGTVPSSSGTPSTSVSDSSLQPNLTAGPLTLPVDGNTALTAGTALFQQAQILDHQISKGLLPRNYDAYLVTFQVNLQPRRRDLSYDAYINVHLMPGDWSEAIATSKAVQQSAKGLPPILVYPLVITDAMETTSVGRSIEAIRQAALQLSGVVSGVGVNAGLSGGSDRLNSVVGLDKNSLVTVGRVSDHTLRIRLGAENSGSAGTAMVPRSYNISVVVLTRNGTPPDQVSNLSVVTEMSLFSTDKGEELGGGPSRRREVLAGRVAKLVQLYGFGTISDSCGGKARPVYGTQQAGGTDEAIKQWSIENSLQLLRAVDRSDYNTVATCLNLSMVGVQDELTLRRLISDLIEVQVDSRFSKMIIPLRDTVALP
ncbi:MAG TPA: hypothetical protein VF491_09430, partial [Vicinamibacterales bacterium]